MPPSTPTPEELNAIRVACDRFLGGHALPGPRATLAALAEEVGADETSDVYGRGPLIERFEQEVADLMGKEAALFLPSGTMAQQIALRVWSDRTGRRTVGFHPTCHLEIHEFKGYEMLAGLHGRIIGTRNRLIALADLEAVAEPLGALLLELPQREIGGILPPWEELQAQSAWARERGIAVHMDGARLWESAPYYDRSYAEILALFDSVYVSFYKSVGAIAGAALAGPADFIAAARIWARRYGGNLIAMYPYVLSARAALRRRLPRFGDYHRRAVDIAAALTSVRGIRVVPDPPHTSMMHVFLPGDVETLRASAVEIAIQERVWLVPTPSLQPASVPGYAQFELTIGDAAESLPDSEISALFARLVRA